MKTVASFLVLFMAMIVSVNAAAIPEGRGIMFDANYSFTLKAPKGWILDNTAAQDSHICAVFYPSGSSWADSPVVFYVNTREARNPQQAVEADMDELHKNGSPRAKAEKVKDLKLKNGKTASIWQYTGDQWGNYEETAFVVEEKGISAMVLTSRSKKGMEDANAAFEELVLSYGYLGLVKIENEPKQGEQLRKGSR